MIPAGFSGRDFFYAGDREGNMHFTFNGESFLGGSAFLGKVYLRKVYFCTRI